MELAIDGVFDQDAAKAARAIAMDQEIDLEDVRIERAAVQWLADASAAGITLDAPSVRMIFTLIKVNNELERIADAAVTIAQKQPALSPLHGGLPPKFRVMANSVIGIMQTTTTALARMDRVAAEIVLASDDATEAFKQIVLKDTYSRLAAGGDTPEHAMALGSIASNLGRMADHCTNIAEQVIYASTGKVVRHEGDRWTKPQEV